MNRTSKQKEAKLHQCELCQKIFSQKSNLDVHRKIHLNKRNFKCRFCTYATYRRDALDSHIRAHTKERPYKCNYPDCNANFPHQSQVIQHQRIHSKDDESKYKCSICPFKTVYKFSFNNHLKTHSNIKEFSCDLCPYQARQKGSLKIHHEVVHLNLKPFRCEQQNCDFVCSQKPQLSHHQLLHAENDEEKEKLLKFKCDQCPYKTTIKGRLNAHLLGTHSSVKEFSCDLCPYRSKHAGNVKSHKKTVHLKPLLKPFKCPQPNCNYAGKTRSDFNRHVKVHTSLKAFACSFLNCGYKTNQKSNLQTHEMIHRGEKPLKCNLCPFTSTHKNSLILHIRGHTGEVPYPCPNCPYRGKVSGNLKRHLKSCKLEKNQGNGPLKKGGLNETSTT